MTTTFTHTFVRSKFLAMELKGFIARTIRLPVVHKVVDHGVVNRCIDWMEIYLHDGLRRKAVIKFRIDWKLHETLISKVIDETLAISDPTEEKASSVILNDLADLLNDFKKEKNLRYWYNVGWISNASKHDEACKITRGGTPHDDVKTKDGSTRTLLHERLRELGMEITIDTDD